MVRVCTYKPNLIYDVGMNNGDDTAYYLAKGYDVIGFEADPKLVGHCRNRFSKEIEECRLIIINGAITNEIPDGYGKVNLYINPHHVWNSCNYEWANRWGSTHSIKVPYVDFLDCLKTYGVPYYMKIDIEGMDYLCLEALQNEWVTYIPNYISVELYMREFLYYLYLLYNLGYTGYTFVQQFKHTDDPYIGWSFNKGSSGKFGNDVTSEWMYGGQLFNKYLLTLNPEYRKWNKINDSKIGRPIRIALERLLNKPLPGWYDIHGKSNVRKRV